MFEVGFFELLLVGLVALLVFGPERLPSLARTAGLWIGRARRFLGTVKADIEQELKAEELKRIIREQQLNNPLHDLIEDTQKSLNEVRRETEASLKSIGDSAKAVPAAPAEPAKPDEAQTGIPAKPGQ